MNVIHRKSWEIPENQATPESIFFNRRQFLVSTGMTIGAAAIPAGAFAAEGDPTADLYPATRNEAYVLDRDVTPEEISSTYNNFYEFGSHKRISDRAQALKLRPWQVKIDGLVEKEQTLDIDTLIRKMSLEERLYRHRCVEAWSMAVPWTGFALSELVALAKPTSDAKYLRFETFNDPDVAAGQRQNWYPWPYVEGVTMAEAMNDLSFMVTGVYGKPLAKQFGAPMRLALPWKYGFKSIKSIVRISFTDKKPSSFWEAILPDEYGFWANVNPEVDHPRWSQARETVLHTGEKVPTLLYNGYADQVASLYQGLENETLFR
ncbi:MAG: protein-methionine-sulfoxide reductase catalytic subunit MsrP [Stappiaceae bacterium]